MLGTINPHLPVPVPTGIICVDLDLDLRVPFLYMYIHVAAGILLLGFLLTQQIIDILFHLSSLTILSLP